VQVLVTGATGYIGRHVVAALLDAGHEPTALVRDAVRASTLLPAGTAIVTGSALQEADVARALAGCEAMVQSAGFYSYNRADVAHVTMDTPGLARAVLGAAARARLSRVVDVSSVVVFTTETDRVDEATRLLAPGDRAWQDPYARAKTIAERIGREFLAAGLPRVVVHPGLVIGPDDRGRGVSGSVLVTLLTGRPATNGRGGFVDIRDVARAIVLALNAPVGSTYLLVAETLSYRDIASRLDLLTGRHPRRTWIPAGVLRPVARINDALGGRLADIPMAPALEYVLTCPPAIDGSRATRDLGLEYRPLDETLADAVRWWVADGKIAKPVAGRLA
jgi:dihydroflavonol-4-reductase